MITRSLSPDTMLLEDAETEIKLLVKRLFLRGANRADIQAAVQKYIRETLKKLKNTALAADAYVSLFKLANRAHNDLLRMLGADGAAVAVAVGLALKGKLTPTVGARVGFNGGVVLGDIPEPIGKGVPLQVYSKEYMKRVNAAMLRLARERAIDPNDLTGRNSLRNLAEMETRYKSHEDEINGFREKGVNLVVISTHADCSDRCFPYQGRVYSLDGTRGKTEDGREYVPLEEATQNPRDLYTTKAGRTYQNGLFGFNCRHKAYEYRPFMRIPKVSREMQQRENAINTKQREYERAIRNKREIALFAEDKKIRQKARQAAVRLNEEYIAFSKKNGRAYYPDRVKILFEK